MIPETENQQEVESASPDKPARHAMVNFPTSALLNHNDVKSRLLQRF